MTASEAWKTAAWVFVGVKLLAFVAQMRMMRGEYRVMPEGMLFRAVYVAGKVSPVLVAGCYAVSAWMAGQVAGAVGLGVVTVAVALLSFSVVRLRQQGRFFGLADVVKGRNR